MPFHLELNSSGSLFLSYKLSSPDRPPTLSARSRARRLKHRYDVKGVGIRQANVERRSLGRIAPLLDCCATMLV